MVFYESRQRVKAVFIVPANAACKLVKGHVLAQMTAIITVKRNSAGVGAADMLQAAYVVRVYRIGGIIHTEKNCFAVP